MCLLCYNVTSFEKQKQFLIECGSDDAQAVNARFEKFNTCPVALILYNCLGVNGDEHKQLGLKAARAFIHWLNTTKPLYYLPQNSRELMYHPDLLTKVVDWCEQYHAREGGEKKNELMPSNQLKKHTQKICEVWRDAHQSMMETSCWYRWRVELTHWLVRSDLCCELYYGVRPVWFRPAPSSSYEMEEDEEEEAEEASTGENCSQAAVDPSSLIL